MEVQPNGAAAGEETSVKEIAGVVSQLSDTLGKTGLITEGAVREEQDNGTGVWNDPMDGGVVSVMVTTVVVGVEDRPQSSTAVKVRLKVPLQNPLGPPPKTAVFTVLTLKPEQSL